ncbi:MAG TPA: hypothetical protein VK255_04155 [Patescibacteria group bacterium]|nr:hypothetical protein [Patescibacteria group bacterium]
MKQLHPFYGREPSLEELLIEIKEESLRNGIADYAAFSEFVDETIEEKAALGFLGEDKDLEKIKDGLKLKWKDIKLELEKKRPSSLIT